ncbi:hypothetical protein K8I85_12675 [bacterium]|nr:hypothetical protein [bacterium]
MTQTPMSDEDFRINALVRRILSRCWIDTESLRFGATGGAVYFHGTFRKLRAPQAADEDDDEDGARDTHDNEEMELLDRIDRELRAEPMVNDVVFRLDNYRQVGGRWAVAERKS